MGLLARTMRDDHRMDIIISLLMFLSILVVLAVQLIPFPQTTRIKTIKFSMNWRQFFTEPYEVLVLVFYDQNGIMFHTYDETKVDVHPSRVIEILRRECDIGIDDVATIIHNHPTPRRFTPGDNYVYNYFLDAGFRGDFMIYYPHSDGVIKK